MAGGKKAKSSLGAGQDIDLNFEHQDDPEPEGLDAFSFGGIVFLIIWFWYGVMSLYFYGTLRNRTWMVVFAALLTPLPCVVIVWLRWREIHNRYGGRSSLLFPLQPRALACMRRALRQSM